MYTDEEFADLLRRGEAGGVEFKQAFPRNDPARFRLVRAALSLSNRADGGYIIMGIEDPATGEQPNITGVPDDLLGEWTYDWMADLFAEFADPRVRFEVEIHPPEGDRRCLVIRVHEFDELPVLCKRDGDGLRRGACYVRPRGKAQTVEVNTHEDMRELIDLATEKALRRLLTRIGRAGGEIVGAEDAVDPYAAEAEGFF